MFDPEKITYFAKTDARGREVRFGIKAKDRQRHMYVIGKTGMGKSTLLENMAAQDIQNGEGMAFIDPHGSAAETLLDYIPKSRINDVVYFAPFDLENPVAFNVMEDVGRDKRHLVVSGLMSTFKKIWVDAWSARMEYILTNALLALIEYPDTTLLSVNRLFSDKAYREKVVDYIKDPAVKAYWTEEFANYTERFAAEALPAIQNKIGQFTGNPLIRNIIGQPKSSFDIRELMDNRKILIMNLSKGLVGETNANLLGSMLTTRIYLAAMSRADLPVEEMKKMPNFYFYVDEFQSFANSTFCNILSEARKYHLNLIIAHQYIEQMEEEVKDAVFGNVGTTVAFRVGPFDAEVLETVFTPTFLAADLVNLGFAQIYLTLMIDGIGSAPFSALTLPPIEQPEVSYKRMAIAASRKNNSHPREEIERLVNELHTPTPSVPKGKNKFKDKNQNKPKDRDVKSNIQHKKDRNSFSNHTRQVKETENSLKNILDEVTEFKETSNEITNVSNTNDGTEYKRQSMQTNQKQNTAIVSEGQNLPHKNEAVERVDESFGNDMHVKKEHIPSDNLHKTKTEEYGQLNALRQVVKNMANGNNYKDTTQYKNKTDIKMSKNNKSTTNVVPSNKEKELKDTLANVLQGLKPNPNNQSVKPKQQISSDNMNSDTPIRLDSNNKNNDYSHVYNKGRSDYKDDPLHPKNLEKILKKGGSSNPPYK